MSETIGIRSCELKAAECERIAANMHPEDEPPGRIYRDVAAKWLKGRQIKVPQRRRR